MPLVSTLTLLEVSKDTDNAQRSNDPSEKFEYVFHPVASNGFPWIVGSLGVVVDQYAQSRRAARSISVSDGR